MRKTERQVRSGDEKFREATFPSTHNFFYEKTIIYMIIIPYITILKINSIVEMILIILNFLTIKQKNAAENTPNPKPLQHNNK
jgi:hypothetical protein